MRVRLSANPVLVKELRGRMRGPRAYLFLTATLALLGGVSYGLYRLAAFASESSYGGVPQGALIGQGVFTGLVFVALMVICAAAPFLTAGAISGEWERKTVDLLLATPLSPASLLFGKLVAALSFIALVLLAAVPLASLSFVFGGVSAEDMLKALFLLLAFAVAWSVIGIFFSALLRRTGAALVASYLMLALFVFGTVFAYLVKGTVDRTSPPAWLLAPNPFAAMASMLLVGGGTVPMGLFPGMDILGPILGIMGGAAISSRRVMPGGVVTAQAVPLWHYTLGLYAWLTAVMYLASTQLVKPVRRFHLRARTWAVVAALLLASILAAPVVYGPFTPARLLAWARWLRSSPHDLVANGTFAAPLEQSWQVNTPAASGGEVAQASASGPTVARLARSGEALAEIGITQAISQTVAADGWLQVRAVLRVLSQDMGMCGEQGDACPLTIKLTYDDAQGLPHEWQQGFYASPGGYMPFCNTCETRQAHIQVRPGEWYTFESPNLLESSVAASEWMMKGMPYSVPPPPRQIHSITVAAAGTSYAAEVAEVALISRAGRPLVWRGDGTTEPAGPTTLPAIAVPVPVKIAPAVPVQPVATSTPVATPAPEATSEP